MGLHFIYEGENLKILGASLSFGPSVVYAEADVLTTKLYIIFLSLSYFNG